MLHLRILWLLCLNFMALDQGNAFSLVMMGARRGKGDLKKSLSNPGTTNNSKGQEITGVTLPADGKIKGWQFGEGVTMASTNVNGRFYAIQGDCPRCAFDLWKGDLIADDPGFDELPRVACPTCASTFSFKSGKQGPPLKRTGLNAFVAKLAKTATAEESSRSAKVFQITRDEEGKVFCLER